MLPGGVGRKPSWYTVAEAPKLMAFCCKLMPWLSRFAVSSFSLYFNCLPSAQRIAWLQAIKATRITNLFMDPLAEEWKSYKDV
ncbi:hypothetical protein Patl1_31383 [Pistacia atlantica]|uniref:Uncharacterized protein n=1 Tax=Pistacia atlantica TaxID=434234 RepID=A0ACC1ANV4_9ROSI|nr:hypothetical protein Patl1_31383 [Pistacia atlantica]